MRSLTRGSLPILIMRRPSCCLAFALLASPLLPAQQPAQQVADAAFTRPLPIHTQAADPIGGTYGYWTAGPAFKASFADGFTFYPWLPGAHETCGLQWRTVSVRLGVSELLPANGEPQVDAYRYQLRRGPVTEIYDVRPEGIEQSFRLDARPVGAGPLVIEGEVTTPFTAAPVLARHGALTFHAGGEPAMVYGAAMAFDSAGHRTTVATSWDGARIRLELDAAFVAAATFPLTVDPLSSAFAVRNSGQPITATSMVAASAPGVTRVVLAVVREFSATDLDAYAFLSADNPAPGMLDVFSDVTTSWSTNSIDACEIAGAGRWALAFEREFPTTGVKAARAYVHDFASSSLNTGTTLFAASNTTSPRIGGMLLTGTKALMVYGSGSDCVQQLVDGQNLTLGAVQTHQTNATEWNIIKASSPAQRWCVATNAGLSPALRLRLVDENGVLEPSYAVPDTSNGTGPELDGLGSRYLLTWSDQTTGTFAQKRVRARRFDFFPNQAPTFQPVRTLLNVSLLTGIGPRDVAFDYTTHSHWAVGFHTRSPFGAFAGTLLRLGYAGGVVETVSINTVQGGDTLLPCVAHCGVQPTGSLMTAGYSAPGATLTALVHRRFEYSPQAGVVYYGTSCSTNVLGDGHPPYAGSETYRLNLNGVAPGTICLHVLGVAPANAPLDGLGMIACRLLVDPLLTTAVLADATGLAVASYALPDDPVFLGDLYAQWFWYEPAANPFGWRSSVGAEVHVR